MSSWFETCRECGDTIEMSSMSHVDGPRHKQWKEHHHTKRCLGPTIDQLSFRDHISNTYGLGLYGAQGIKHLFEGWDLDE